MTDNRAVIIRVVLILLCAVVLWMVVKYYNAHKSSSFSASRGPAPERFDDEPRKKVRFQMQQQGDGDDGGGAASVYGGGPSASSAANQVDPSSGYGMGGGGAPYGAVEPQRDEQHRAIACADGGTAPSSCYPQDQLKQSDLLPRDASNSLWAQVNPAGQGDLKDQNFLTAGYLLGIDTVGESLRNANVQLRSEPPNPQFSVGPWQQSTITPDTSRRPFELGGDY